MLQVDKIDDVFLSFDRGKIGKKAAGKVRKRLRGRIHLSHGGEDPLVVLSGVLFAELIHGIPGALSEGHGDLFFGRIHFRILLRIEPGKGGRLRGKNLKDPLPQVFRLLRGKASRVLCGGHVAESTDRAEIFKDDRNIEGGTVRLRAEV